MGPRTIVLAVVHALTAGCLAVSAQRVILLWNGWPLDLVPPAPPLAYPGLPAAAMFAGALLGPVLHATLRIVLNRAGHSRIGAAAFGVAYTIALMAVTIVAWSLSDEVPGRPPGQSVAEALALASFAVVAWLPMFVGAGLMLVGPLVIIAGAMIGLAAAEAETRNAR